MKADLRIAILWLAFLLQGVGVSHVASGGEVESANTKLPNVAAQAEAWYPDSASVHKLKGELEKDLCANNPVESEPAAVVAAPNYGHTEAGVCIECQGNTSLSVEAFAKGLSRELQTQRMKRELPFLKNLLNNGSTDPIVNSAPWLTLEILSLQASMASFKAKHKVEKENLKRNKERAIAVKKLIGMETLTSGERQILSQIADKELKSRTERLKELGELSVVFKTLSKNNKISEDLSSYYGGKLNGLSQAVEQTESDMAKLKTLKTWLGPGESVDGVGLSPNELKTLLSDYTSVGIDEGLLDSEFQDKIKWFESKIIEYQKKLKEIQESKALAESASSDGNNRELEEFHRLESQALQLVTDPKFQSGVGEINKYCGMTVTERLAISQYTGDGFVGLNSRLRAGKPLSEDMASFAEVLKAALLKLKPFKGIVRRGARIPLDALEAYQPGAVIDWPAFTSTSIGSGFKSVHRFAIKSKSGRYLDPFSRNSGELEVLIPPGKFKILSRKEVGSGIEFVMEEQ